MKLKCEVFLIIFVIDSSIAAPTKKSTQSNQVKSEKDAYAWLNKYGYNPCKNAGVQCSLGFDSIIKEYQERFRLKPTGKLDAATRSHMNRPRCGIEDKDPAKLSAAPQALRLKWSRSSLTYALKGYPSELSESKTSQIIREAFDAWLAHIPMEITGTCSTCKSDFVVDFEREKHSDNYPFDGSGGTLAHAFFPEDGRIHFDKDEEWTESFNGEKINLYLVAVHEIGHALGLDHIYDEESIMYPSYKLMKKSDILPRTDRETIQKLYGTKNSPSTSTSRSTTTTTKSTTTTMRTTTTSRSVFTSSSSSSGERIHPRCRILLDAAFVHPDGTFHTFNAGILWRYLIREGNWEHTATSYNAQYPDLPRKINAGVYDKNANQIVFFSDSSVFQYDLDSRNRATLHSRKQLPKNLQNSIVGAIYYHDKIHVITAKTIRQYPFGRFYQNSKENDLDEEFPNFRGTLITAFTSGKSHYFFTQDRLVSVWNEASSSWSTLRKPMETSWFACTGKEMFIPNRFNTERQGYGHNRHDHQNHNRQHDRRHH